MSRRPVDRRLEHPRYVRSNRYDPQWVLDNQMGPNALWLIEALTAELRISSGMRVLDLGCGSALTSIFLAREFRARVWATDLWIDADENGRRIDAAGVGDLVIPVQADAHFLPFATGFFDAIVSVDAYHYFGTDDLYLAYLVGFLRAGCQIGIVVPAVTEEMPLDVSEEIAQFWEPAFYSFHSPHWWETHWRKAGVVDVVLADAVVDGWADWLRFAEITLPSLSGSRLLATQREIAMLRADDGKRFGFARVVAAKPSTPAPAATYPSVGTGA
jgi:SAM-dependent methyltransferase